MKHLPQGRKGIVVLNVSYNVVGYGCRMMLGIFLMPYIVKMLGIERFGIWAVTAVITGYLGLFDFGISVAFIKYLSEFYAKSDFNRIGRIVSTGFLIYLVLTSVMLLLFCAIKDLIYLWFKIPSPLQAEAGIAFFSGILTFGVVNALYAFSAIPQAMQRFGIANLVSVIFAMLGAGSTVFVLSQGYGLKGLAISGLLVACAQQTANIFVAYFLLPKIEFNPLRFNKDVLLQLFRFGTSIQIARISGWISTQVDKILIGLLLSLSMITYYELGSTVMTYLMGMSGLLVSPLLPAFSDLKVRESEEQLVLAYVTSLRYGVGLILPLFLFVALCGNDIMQLWMGANFAWVGGLITILCLAFAVNAIAQIPASMCIVIDRADFLATGSIIIIVSNTLLSFVLIKMFGFWGAAWGTVIAVNVGTFYFLFRLHKSIAVKFQRFLRILLPFLIASSIALVPVFLFDYFAPAESVSKLYSLLTKGVIFFGFYMLIIWKQHMLGTKEV